MNCYIYYAVTLKGIANNGDSMRVVTAIPALIEFPFLFMKKEIWKDIPGIPTYRVSNMGRLERKKIVFKSRNQYGNFETIREKKIIKQHMSKEGYMCTSIYYKHYRTHRLVASAFLGLDLNNSSKFVCHKNDIRNDNRLENLFIGTVNDNVKDMISKNRQCKGESIYLSKLTEKQVKEIKTISRSISNLQVANIYGVDKSQISRIRNNKTWKHII